MVIRFFAVLFAVIFFPFLCLGESQASDIVRFMGKEYILQTNILEYYFERQGISRDSLMRSVTLVDSNGNKSKFSRIRPECLRGYIATFEVTADGELYLNDIQLYFFAHEPYEVEGRDSSRAQYSIMHLLFPGQRRVQLDWYTGLLIVPYGDVENYVYSGYASVFEQYMVMVMREGRYLRHINYDSRQYIIFRSRQFAMFKRTNSYRSEFTTLKVLHEDWDDARIEEYISLNNTLFASRMYAK